jgi:TolB protein
MNGSFDMTHCLVFMRVKVLLCALALLVASTAANAQLRIEIRRGVERPVPIAIVPFSWEAAPGRPLPVDVSGVVTTDLAGSGRFAPLPERDMVSRPNLPEQVDIQDWQILEVDVVVIGRVQLTGPDDYTVVFQIYDVLRGEQLVGYRLTTTGEQLRFTAHRVADMIYEELTGIPGVFSTQVAYISEQRQNGQQRFRLIVADADGENAQIVADSPDPIMSPSWSPDGRQLAYVSFEGNQAAVYIQTLRTGVRDRVSAREGVNGAPAFSPDGRRLALTLSRDAGNLEIFTLDLTTQVLNRVTNSPAIDTEPTWSADGDSIFFTSDRSGGPQIYRVDARPGASAERVTFEGAYNARARVSPDGRQLAVVHRDRGNYRIAVVDPRNGLTQVLTSGALDESPSFAPNGAVIIYATREGGRGVLSSVSTDGRIQQQIASVDGDVREPVWSPYARP